MENEVNLTLDHLVFCPVKNELLVNILVTISLKKSMLLWSKSPCGGGGGGEYSTNIWI